MIPLGLAYWLLLILAVIFGLWSGYGNRANNPMWFGAPLVELLLFVLIGLALFGHPIRGY
jgi:hypothetical protein